MKFQVGDKVVVRHSNEEGEVIDVINDKMVMVEVKGVRFPAYSDQIEFPYFKRFMEQKKAAPAPKKTIEQLRPEPARGPQPKFNLQPGVWLTFFPIFDKDVFDDDVVDYFKVYLVNQTALELNFQYTLRLNGEAGMELSSNIQAFSDFYLQNVPMENVNDSPKFDFDFALTKPQKGKSDHFEASHKLKPKQLFQKVESLRQNQEASFAYLLFDKYPDAPFQETVRQKGGLDLSSLSKAGFKLYDAGKARQHLEPARSVVDLHADKLTHPGEKLSPDEILHLQLSTFEKYFELAVLHHLPVFTVIHGVGTGRLRDEIHEILHTKKEVKSFVNQYLNTYGYGATEVFFQ
jgi:hypothetical protein